MEEFRIVLVVIYFVILNAAGFITMGLDKRRAVKRQWRISETRLLILAFLGGGLGSFAGMYLFRHKTKHVKFVILIPLSIIIYLIVGMKLFAFI